jgi:quercetin dioxygenase-like cupin family protein
VSGVVSISELIDGLAGPWQPVDVVQANDAVVRLARFEGEFPWHHHDEDELFLCWDGTFRIELEGHPPVILGAGDIYVVPKGIRHRPVADTPAHVVLVERPETKQYGN